MVEVNSETDFVARRISTLVRTIAQLALEIGGDRERLMQATVPGRGAAWRTRSPRRSR